MTPLPARSTRHGGTDRAASRSERRASFVFSFLAALALLAGAAFVLVDIAPRARDYRLIAGGIDVHGTPVACSLASDARGDPRAVLRLAYMTPSGRFEIAERTRFGLCSEALAEPRDHRVLYAPDRPGLAVPLAEAHPLRLRLIATMAGALAIGALGAWSLSRLIRRLRS